MTNTVLLEKAIEKSGYRKSYIAKVLGLTRYGLLKKIKNETEFKASEVNALCTLLKITSLREKEQIFFAKKVDL